MILQHIDILHALSMVHIHVVQTLLLVVVSLLVLSMIPKKTQRETCTHEMVPCGNNIVLVVFTFYYLNNKASLKCFIKIHLGLFVNFKSKLFAV